jgi:hypothetical protein
LRLVTVHPILLTNKVSFGQSNPSELQRRFTKGGAPRELISGAPPFFVCEPKDAQLS